MTRAEDRRVDQHLGAGAAAVAETGLDVRARVAVLTAVIDFVRGNAIRCAEVLARTASAPDPQTVDAMVAYGVEQLRTGGFPQTAGVFGLDDPRSGKNVIPSDPSSLEAEFGRGLTMLLDGIAQTFRLN